MYPAGLGDPRADVLQKWNDASRRKVDVQVHHLLCGGALRRFAMIDFVRKVKALAVGTDDLGSDA